MKAKSLGTPALAVALAAGVTGLIGAATAADASREAKAARSTVTIDAAGIHLSGKVASPRKSSCASGRRVWVVMQMGTRGGGNDMTMGWVAANRRGSWSASPGMAGRFYAVVKAKPACRADSSPTVRAHR